MYHKNKYIFELLNIYQFVSLIFPIYSIKSCDVYHAHQWQYVSECAAHSVVREREVYHSIHQFVHSETLGKYFSIYIFAMCMLHPPWIFVIHSHICGWLQNAQTHFKLKYEPLNWIEALAIVHSRTAPYKRQIALWIRFEFEHTRALILWRKNINISDRRGALCKYNEFNIYTLLM